MNLTNFLFQLYFFLEPRVFTAKFGNKLYVVLKSLNRRKMMAIQNMGFEDSKKGIVDISHWKISLEKILGSAICYQDDI